MRRRSRAIEQLLGRLADPNGDERCAALEIAFGMDFQWVRRRPRPPEWQIDAVFRAVNGLLRRDPEADVRHAAAHLLTFWFQPRAPRALIPVLEDVAEQERIRGQAAEGIGNVLGDDRGAKPLRARAVAALRKGLADPAPEVRFWCLYGLGQMKATEARAEVEDVAARDEGMCPFMWRVADEATDVLTYWDAGTWPERDFDPDAKPIAG